MRYLVDGNNLLHALWPADARSSKGPAWRRLQRRLLDRLAISPGGRRGGITVVFDAARAPEGLPASFDLHGVHVVYAVNDPTADDCMEKLIDADKNPTQLTIVSNDHRPRDAGRRRGCAVAGCLDFDEIMHHSGNVTRDKQPTQDIDASKPEAQSSQEVELWLRIFGPPT